jgi:hypothetical protein
MPGLVESLSCATLAHARIGQIGFPQELAGRIFTAAALCQRVRLAGGTARGRSRALGRQHFLTSSTGPQLEEQVAQAEVW